MFIVGIDIAKRSHEAIIIAEDGQVVRKAFSFRNNCTGYNLLAHVEPQRLVDKLAAVFAITRGQPAVHARDQLGIQPHHRALDPLFVIFLHFCNSPEKAQSLVTPAFMRVGSS